MIATAGPCPGCGGRRLVGDVLGLRFLHGFTCVLGAAEDATVVADVERAEDAMLPGFYRAVTAAERELLAACGVTLPDGARTRVYVRSRAVRVRQWDGVDLGAGVPV